MACATSAMVQCSGHSVRLRNQADSARQPRRCDRRHSRVSAPLVQFRHARHADHAKGSDTRDRLLDARRSGGAREGIRRDLDRGTDRRGRHHQERLLLPLQGQGRARQGADPALPRTRPASCSTTSSAAATSCTTTRCTASSSGSKLFAEMMANLPEAHPGCLAASFAYQDQLFNREIRELNADGHARLAAPLPRAARADRRALSAAARGRSRGARRHGGDAGRGRDDPRPRAPRLRPSCRGRCCSTATTSGFSSRRGENYFAGQDAGSRTASTTRRTASTTRLGCSTWM